VVIKPKFTKKQKRNLEKIMGGWLDSAKKNIHLRAVHGNNILKEIERSDFPI
jgi:hypothetical protein